MELQALFQEEIIPYAPWPRAPILIYGAGSCGREACRILNREGYQVDGFVDLKADQLKEVDGVPCWAPDAPELLKKAQAGNSLLLAVFNYAVDLEPIQKLMEDKGFSKIISYYEFMEMMKVESNPYWFSPRTEVKKWTDQWRALEDLWADKRSHEIYLETLKFRLTFGRGLLNQPDLSHSYFPEDIPPLPRKLRMVDGGGFTGDTILNLINNGFDFESLAVFEPDPENFLKLKSTVESLRLNQVQLFCSGLGSSTEKSHFEAGKGGSSCRSESGELIDIISIDEALAGFNPNFIKMDIEGSELSALNGAAKTIEQSGCRLAICTYHRPNDLWEIALQLKKSKNKYRFYLRYHGYNGFDQVLYAVPL